MMDRNQYVKRKAKRDANRGLTLIMALFFALSGMLGAMKTEADAAASTVTLKYGTTITYGSGLSGYTSLKWVTHIDGEEVDLDDEPGVTRSYAYCVQPIKFAPDPGTYPVTLIDDDDTGRISKMRKLIYYLPGSYGYAKTTKKRWFSGYSVNDAYVLGHLALSWIYESYSESDSVWGGAPSSTENKAKGIVEDLTNLPDPPDDYEVFWVKASGKQDVFGAFYNAEYGRVGLTKSSSIPKVSDGNKCYSLEGAEFTLYEDEECKEVAKFKDGSNAVLKTKTDGTTPEYDIETGEYYIKETKAPKGYAIDSKAHKIEVKKDKTYTYSCKDTPIMDIVNLLLTKNPKGYPQKHGEGDASLAGAVYKFSYYDGQYSSASAAEGSGKAMAEWYFTTDAKGEIGGTNPQKATGYTSSDLYKDADGKIAFPLGSYVIQEAKAPAGYLINSEKVLVTVTEDGSGKDHVKTYNEKASNDDAIIRGGVKLAKIDNDLDEVYLQGEASFSGAEFTIYNKSKESVMVGGKEIAKDAIALVVKTDANGMAATSADALPYGTYQVKETKAPTGYLVNAEWSSTFTIRENGKIVDKSESKVREIVERGGVQIVKRDKEIQKSEALGGASLSDIVFTIKNVSAHDVVVRKDIGNTTDKVDWKKLASKKELFDSGAIKRVKSGEDVGKIVTHWNEEKKAYTSETLADDLPYGTYTIRESKTNNSYQRTDKTEHKFEVRKDGTIYAYGSEGLAEILSFDDYVYRSDVQGTKIGDGDSRRFSLVPFKITSVTNGETHVVVTDRNGFFSTKDRRTKDSLDEDEDADNTRKQNLFDDLLTAEDIRKSDLEKRSADILMGVWFGTGELGTHAERNDAYGALPYDSYIIEEIPFDGNEGYAMQKFFFTVDEKSQNGFVDLETITDDIPEIGTKAAVNRKNVDVSPAKEITLIDTIEYKNLTKGETYTAKGRLIDKVTGETIKDASDSEIAAETTFEAKRSNGKVKVEFRFDGSNMYGKETVVFETVYDAAGHVIAKHEDIDDEDQTVSWREEEHPRIGTTLTADGKKEVITSEKTVLVDEVSYEGLYTDQWYVITGTLMVKDTGDPLVENGEEITVTSEPFNPVNSSGKQEMTFEIDTTGLEGKELVAFETCYRLDGYRKGEDAAKAEKTVVAGHKDINDKGQTVKIVRSAEPNEPDEPDAPDAPYIPEKPDTPDNPQRPNTPDKPQGPITPDTGDYGALGLYTGLTGMAICGLTAFALRETVRKRKREEEYRNTLI